MIWDLTFSTTSGNMMIWDLTIKDAIKKYLKKHQNLYSLARNFLAWLYVIRYGFLLDALKNFYTKNRVIIFFRHPSHVLNIPSLPTILSKFFKKNDILIICQFSKKEAPEQLHSCGITVKYSVNPIAIKIFRCLLFITPASGLGKEAYMPENAIKVHFLHSISGLEGIYLDCTFDGFDYIFCAGEHHIEDFLKLAKKRKWTNKVLIRGGYPKLDYIIFKYQNKRDLNKVILDRTVIYAPTFVYDINQKLTSLRENGARIVNKLLAAGFKVIFRPHPVSFFNNDDRSLIERIAHEHKDNENFFLDRSEDYFETYAKAAILITDISGTAFTFSFAFERPVIFFINKTEEIGYGGINFFFREKIGETVSTPEELIVATEKIFSSYHTYRKKIVQFRQKIIFNIGVSEQYFVDNLDFIINHKRHPDWVYL